MYFLKSRSIWPMMHTLDSVFETVTHGFQDSCHKVSGINLMKLKLEIAIWGKTVSFKFEFVRWVNTLP